MTAEQQERGRAYATIKAVIMEALTSHEYNDVTGVVTVNVCDALFAIATAINRVAVAIELDTAAQAEMRANAEQLAAAMTFVTGDESDGPGHA